ncbi:hypothetical protein [Streptomyces vastus]|uniref:GlsB/YeaQ/YmgE family stress response membrane protein n=1 Tax=Streptomyces vastus TaxID=285451 RepID=A0ABP6DP53_9ACTN
MTYVEFGAMSFGMVIGWFTYFVNRYRPKVAITDVLAIVGALGGGTILTLFPEETQLFAAYGIGLAIGFFGYFLLLVVLVLRSKEWTMEWFLDGRRPELKPGQVSSDATRTGRPMGGEGATRVH